MVEHIIAAKLQVLGIRGSRFRQQALKGSLALSQRLLSKIAAVEVQKIERKKDELRRVWIAQFSREGLEVRQASGC